MRSGVSSLSTGISTNTSTIGSLSTGLSTADSSIASLSTGASTTASTAASNVASLSTGVSALQHDALQWDPSLGAYDASHGAGSPQRVANVAPGTVGASSTDAVNGSQLYATNQTLVTLSSNVATGTLGVVQRDGTGQVAVLTAVGGTAANPGSAQVLTNLANGEIATASRDAINGAQLYGLSKTIANYLGGRSTVDASGTITAPNYTIGGTTYQTIGDTFGAVDQNLTSLNQQISLINQGAIKYFHYNTVLADSQAIGANSLAVGPAAVATGTAAVATGLNAQAKADNTVALGANANANHAGDVALGAGSTSAAAVQTSTMAVNGVTYTVAGTARATVSIGDVGNERTLTNLAAGRVSATSTDAVNGSQLFATNQQIASLGSSISAVSGNAVRYDLDGNGNKTNTVTLQGADPNAPVVVTNVAAATRNSDAVNFKQVKDIADTTLTSANTYTDTRSQYAIATANSYTDQKAAQTYNASTAYTDQKFHMLTSSMNSVRNEARQAAALGLAAASMQFDSRPGKLSVGFGGGAWRGQAAASMGVGYTSDDQSMRANISASTAGSDWGVAAGLSFTLN